MNEQALLGLATSRELLEELKVRFEVHFDELHAASVFNFYLTNLPKPCLDYRTVDAA